MLANVIIHADIIRFLQQPSNIQSIEFGNATWWQQWDARRFQVKLVHAWGTTTLAAAFAGGSHGSTKIAPAFAQLGGRWLDLPIRARSLTIDSYGPSDWFR